MGAMCGEATFHIKGSLKRGEGGPGGGCLAETGCGDSEVTWTGRRGRHKVVSRREESGRAAELSWMSLNAAGFSMR